MAVVCRVTGKYRKRFDDLKVGDVVRIRDIGWYNKNKGYDGSISPSVDTCQDIFTPDMSKFCGMTAVVKELLEKRGSYKRLIILEYPKGEEPEMSNDKEIVDWNWHDWMLENGPEPPIGEQ